MSDTTAPRNLYIADLHIGHGNILYLDNRPFKDINEMREAIRSNWQAAVNPQDTVYILGDLFWDVDYDSQNEFLASLPGKKILIQGNHDTETNYSVRHLYATYDYLEIEDGGTHVVLSHYPVISHHGAWHKSVQIYGHVHNNYEARIAERVGYEIRSLYQKPYRAYNAGCMMPWMNYTPRTLYEIEARYKDFTPYMADNAHETSRMLTLSTAHISGQTADLLSNGQEADTLGLAVYPKISGNLSFGWFVYLQDKVPNEWPDDLRRCAAFAASLGCHVICFDSDGPKEPSLQKYEW